MTRLAASLWSVPPREQSATAGRLAAAGVSVFHWDDADGSMGPAGGFLPGSAEALMPSGSRGEAHIMARDPRPSLAAWSRVVDRIAVHVNQPYWHESVATIRDLGTTPVLAVHDGEELAQVPAEIGVLVMAVAPGHAGTGFAAGTLDLVRTARLAGHPTISVDGSVTLERALVLSAAGATDVVSGTALTAADDPGEWVRLLGRAERR